MSVVAEIVNINLLAVLCAALSSFILGMTWYSWPVFGKAWATLLGMTQEEANNTDGLTSTLSVAIVGSFIAAGFLALLAHVIGITTIIDGIVLGALAGFALRLTSIAFHNGFSRQPVNLTLINAAHDIVQLAIMGGIIGFLS